MAPLLRSFVSPEEVYRGRMITYEDVVAVAGSLNRDETLHFLGFLNLVLTSATTESHLSGSSSRCATCSTGCSAKSSVTAFSQT